MRQLYYTLFVIGMFFIGSGLYYTCKESQLIDEETKFYEDARRQVQQLTKELDSIGKLLKPDTSKRKYIDSSMFKPLMKDYGSIK